MLLNYDPKIKNLNNPPIIEMARLIINVNQINMDEPKLMLPLFFFMDQISIAFSINLLPNRQLRQIFSKNPYRFSYFLVSFLSVFYSPMEYFSYLICLEFPNINK